MFKSPSNPNSSNDFNKSSDLKPNSNKSHSNFKSKQRPKFNKDFKHKSRFSNSHRDSNGDGKFTKFNSNSKEPRTLKPEISALVKRVSRLKTEKGRLESSMFLIEGTNQILDVIKISPNILNEIFISKQYEIDHSEETRKLKNSPIQVTAISDDEIKALSTVQTPPGVIAKAYFSNLKINWNTAQTITILDSVQDPGNVGAIFRTALAMKHDAILLGKGTCEPYNPKVVRSSVGQFLQMPFEVNLSLDHKISFLRKKGFTILSTSIRSLNTLNNITLKNKIAFIIGNEGSGVSERLSISADYEISIPLHNSVESLNASVSHGILSHELNQIKKKLR